MRNKFLTFLLLLQASGLAYGYDVETHRAMTIKAVQASNLPTRLPDLGFTGLDDKVSNDLFDFGSAIVICLPLFSRPQLIQDVIGQGAVCEDATLGGANVARYSNHFYDPAHGGAGFLGTFSSSLDWGLKTTPMLTQDYSYKDAKDYLYKGLTLPSKSDRDINMRKTFRTLGHVAHLIEDLAQPQHTRNDDHHTGSLYERYTDRKDIREALPYGGYGAAQIVSLDQLWHTASGMGLADFSNSNFVSSGTIFKVQNGQVQNGQPALVDYSSPIPGNIQTFPVANLSVAQNIKDQCANLIVSGQITACDMTFVQTLGMNLGQSVTVDHGASLSIFDEAIAKYAVAVPTYPVSSYDKTNVIKNVQANRKFTLNRFNFDAVHPYLIPRAVGYAASMINYFFRGKMEISLPKEGVYGVVDHGQNPAGFNVIKLKLKNVSMNGTTGEAMSGGTFVVVAKYHRNLCYKSDLSGEYQQDLNGVWDGKTPCPNFRSVDEEISVSDAAVLAGATTTLTGLAYGEQQELQVSFSQKPIPINATDLYLQVVYKGKLGAEDNAVAVTTKDISEPSYHTFSNSTDQYCANGKFYDLNNTVAVSQLLQVLKNENLINNNLTVIPDPFLATPLDFTFAFGTFPSQDNKISKMPAGGFSRIAVLGDWANAQISLVISGNSYYKSVKNQIALATNQQDTVKNTLYFTSVYTTRSFKSDGGIFIYRSDRVLNCNLNTLLQIAPNPLPSPFNPYSPITIQSPFK